MLITSRIYRAGAHALFSVVALYFVTIASATPAQAQAEVMPQTRAKGPVTGLPMPRFVSLNAKGAGAVNTRTGPGVQYPIKWIYKRPHLPVQIIAEYELWRRIKDQFGDDGWVHKSLLSGRRTAIVTSRIRVAYQKPDVTAIPVFLAQPGVIARIDVCESQWCRVHIKQQTGWMMRDHLWGTFEAEAID